MNWKFVFPSLKWLHWLSLFKPKVQQRTKAQMKIKIERKCFVYWTNFRDQTICSKNYWIVNFSVARLWIFLHSNQCLKFLNRCFLLYYANWYDPEKLEKNHNFLLSCTCHTVLMYIYQLAIFHKQTQKFIISSEFPRKRSTIYFILKADILNMILQFGENW